MYWNVHIDGLEYTHDLIVEREGVFKECVEAIKMAKILGYQVAPTRLLQRNRRAGNRGDVQIFLLAWRGRSHDFARYDYDAAKKDMAKRLGKDPKQFFLTRR